MHHDMKNTQNNRTSIYTNADLTKSVAQFISENRTSCYIGMKGSNTYYNVNGFVWEVFHDGCGNYPTSEGIKIENFTL
jgi:hypothetical protein